MTTPEESCDCCSGVEPLTPASESNPPGENTLHYRVGTHGRFLQSMLAKIGADPKLATLTTRSSDDSAVALMDAWASVLDVLSFYQERIANEGFLRTATERRSVLELGRAIGYELRPGVAASTMLAFTLETAPGAPSAAQLDAGLRVQSVPEQDEHPQVFETLAGIQARAAWNALEVTSGENYRPKFGDTTLFLKGVITGLKPGDSLLIIGDERRNDPTNENWDFRRVTRLQMVPPPQPSADPLAGYTVVALDRTLGSEKPFKKPAADNPICYALRTRANCFGQAAPDWKAMPLSLRTAYTGKRENDSSFETFPQWPNFTLADISGDSLCVVLEALYPGIVADSWVVLSTPDEKEVYKVSAAEESANTQFTLSSKGTRLALHGERLKEIFNNRVRETLVHAESVELPWAQRPLPHLLTGLSIDLATLQPDLVSEQWLAVTGLVLSEIEGARAESALVRNRIHDGHLVTAIEISRDELSAVISFADGESHTVALERRSEVVQIRRNLSQKTFTRLELKTNLENAYLPASVRVNANVAPASHGDSRQMQVQPEVLGSGDSSRPRQKFSLLQHPLTYIAAATPSGAESTLEIRVDGLRWKEATCITAMRPNDRCYLLRQAEGGAVTIQFGDGQHGARLPSGQSNVEARYRVGLGTAGNLKQSQISQLMQRPLGLKEVTNPIPASGGTAAEATDEARRNLPMSVRTLDRIVSLQDFEDFAAAFTGIGKAQAVWLWDGQTRLVHLTVAGMDGVEVTHDSALFRNLAQAIDDARPPHQPMKLATGQILRFGLSAELCIHADYSAEKVITSVRSVLATCYDFHSRHFGQSLTGSDVLARMQAVDGVASVDLNSVHLHGEGISEIVNGPNSRLRIRGAHWQENRIVPAQLLVIDSNDIEFRELQT